MKRNGIIHMANIATGFLILFAFTLLLGAPVSAVAPPRQLPLWEQPPQDLPSQDGVKEQMRSNKARPGSPSGLNRVYSSVSAPTYSIHRPENPNGVGLVICPGGGFRDVWIDREGHDLAILLKGHNITSLVLKYRTRPLKPGNPATARENYMRAVQADARQAIRILRERATDLGLNPEKIGVSGFSAGGHLALTTALRAEPKPGEDVVSGMPNFAGLFYPGIPDDVSQIMESRLASDSPAPDICPLFIMNARVDKLTPAEKCVDFYAKLLKAGINAELHIYGKGYHGFDLGAGAGKSAAIWPTSFIAWLRDINMISNE